MGFWTLTHSHSVSVPFMEVFLSFLFYLQLASWGSHFYGWVNLGRLFVVGLDGR